VPLTIIDSVDRPHHRNTVYFVVPKTGHPPARTGAACARPGGRVWFVGSRVTQRLARCRSPVWILRCAVSEADRGTASESELDVVESADRTISRFPHHLDVVARRTCHLRPLSRGQFELLRLERIPVGFVGEVQFDISGRDVVRTCRFFCRHSPLRQNESVGQDNLSVMLFAGHRVLEGVTIRRPTDCALRTSISTFICLLPFSKRRGGRLHQARWTAKRSRTRGRGGDFAPQGRPRVRPVSRSANTSVDLVVVLVRGSTM